jgi:hypothetical protein
MELRSVIAALKGLSRRLLLRIVLLGTSRLVLVALLLCFATFFADWTLDLPKAVRTVLLAGSGLLLLIEVGRHLIAPLLRKPSVDELALLAEASDPALNDQLISAIQLERDLRANSAVESPEMIQALISETATRFKHHRFQKAVSLRPCVRPLTLATLAIVGTAVLANAFPDHAGLWIKRQLLLRDDPWPRKHHLILSVADESKYDRDVSDDGKTITLHVSERTPIQVRVSDENGELPDEVELVTRFEGDEEDQRIAMGRTSGNPYFQHIFPPLVRSVTFHAVGGDDRDDFPSYSIRVARAPRITRYFAHYDPPAYTGLEAKTLPDANITAPEGTRITMNFEANMPLESFGLLFENQGAQSLTANAEGVYRTSFVVDSNDFYTYQLKGENGVSSVDTPRYVITSQSDQAPRIAIDMPRATSLLLTPQALIPLRGTVTDDYGVTRIGIRYGADARDLDAGEVAIEGASLLEPLGSRQVPFFHVLPVGDLILPARAAGPDSAPREQGPVTIGDRLAFKFLATDNRSTSAAPEPHRSFGDYEYLVQVLSVEDLEREMAQRQSRLRNRVEEIQHLTEARILEIEEIVAGLRTPTGAQPESSRLWQLDQDQNRITVELKASARQFITSFDAYLWNRVDEGALTDNLISNLSRAWRASTTDDPFKIYGEAVTTVKPLVDETKTMGRLTAILALFLQTSAELSPEIQRQISRATLMAEPENRLESLLLALDMEQKLRDDLVLLKTKLEAWEDYLDVVQKLRSLLDQQRGIREKIEDLTKKK